MPPTIETETLSDDAIGVEPVTVDGWEGWGDVYEFAAAPSCGSCGGYARWRAWRGVEDERTWRCVTKGCENEGEEVEQNGDDGPMMNYYYPLPSPPSHDSTGELADLIYDLPLCVVEWQDGRGDRLGSDEEAYALALSGGGMDLSWEICEAFMRLGLLPPVHFADLPGISGRGGRERDKAIVAACVRSLDVGAERLVNRSHGLASTAKKMRERYLA